MEHIPLFTPGAAVTFTAGSPVIGGRLVEIAGDRTVALATANSAKTIGVAAFDAAANENVTIWALTGVHRLQASAPIAAGALVSAADNGKCATSDGSNVIGIALQAAATADEFIEVQGK